MMNKKLRILFLSQYFPPEMGAPSARTFELSRKWVKNEAHVTVITGFPHHPTGVIPNEYKGYKFLKEQKEGINVIRTFIYATPNKGKIKRILGYVSFMFSSIIQGSRKCGKQDVIIATSPQFFVGIAGYIISRIKRIPFIFEVRDLWPESIKQLGQITNPLIINFLETIESFLYRKAVKVIGVADSTLDILSNKGVPQEKINIVKNGVDLNLFNIEKDSDEIKDKLNLKDKFIISYIGTHGLSHALDKVLDTANILNNKEEIYFLLVGEGAEKENLIKQAKNQNISNVKFIDQISKLELPLYYSICNIVLITLRDLPLFQCVIPSKMFEIMAMSKPIIISVDGEAKNMVVDKAKAGIFSIPEDPKDLKNKILYLYNNKDMCKKLGANGRKFVEKYFNRDKLADEYLKIIKSALQTNLKH